MKVSRRFLQKIIQEEINNTTSELSGDPEQQLVQLLVAYRDELINSDLEQPDSVTILRSLKKEMSKVMPGLNMIRAIKSLKGKIDHQLYTFFIDAIHRGSGAKLKPDGFSQDPSTRKDPDPGFMRVPKKDAAYN